MRFKVAQLDTSATSGEGIKRTEKDLNDFVEKIEKGGNVILGEHFTPQQNAVRSILILEYEKGIAHDTKYSYQILDSRNGYGVVDKLLNEKVLALEKSGRKVIRSKLIPMRNDAFVQMLLVHEPGKRIIKNVPTPEGVVKDIEVKEDGKETVKSTA